MSRRIFSLALLCSSIVFLCLGLTARSIAQQADQTAAPLSIDIWYGDEQRFGHLGSPQKWVNILGRVTATDGLLSLRYSLNGAAAMPLSVGPDRRRLAAAGDFNVEIDRMDLLNGTNVIDISAVDSSGNEARKTVSVQYTKGRTWPIPYSIDWSTVKSIQDVVQVVDGRWKLTPDGLRVLEPYYDRVIGFGDVTWENYEVTVSVIFHGFRQPVKGLDGGANVIHAAIAVRWPGHDEDGNQPRVKWYPLGATAEFRLTPDPDHASWRILGGGGKVVNETSKRAIEFETQYMMKHRVETLSNGNARYSVKFWEAARQEPAVWDLTSEKDRTDVQSGGALILAHYTDLTFGNVTVVPVPEN